ncbi:MAG: nitrile hydratase subunit beta [Pseudomonadota bacterium]
MNGGADLGGMMGLGPIAPEADAPNFHAAWEARVMGMVVALGACGAWNIDQSRFARESLPPADYLRFSYYRIWLEGAQRLMLERGMLTEAELTSGTAQAAPVPIRRTLAAQDVRAALDAGGPVDRPPQMPARFTVGDPVRTINEHPDSHTRLPRYARGKAGRIARIHGVHVFADSNARGDGEDPQWLYKVAFEATELWGSRARAGDIVTLDLWEPYLRPAP